MYNVRGNIDNVFYLAVLGSNRQIKIRQYAMYVTYMRNLNESKGQWPPFIFLHNFHILQTTDF